VLKHLRLSLILLILLFSAEVWAFKCFVISGVERDRKGLWDGNRFIERRQSARIRGHNCIVLDTWEDLSKPIYRLNRSTDNVLIMNMTHGGSMGGTMCNAGNVRGVRILEILRNLSRNRRVAVNMESCFSGDLIAKKIMTDSLANPSIENLCLSTNSLFGRVSLGNFTGESEFVKKVVDVKKGQSYESLFWSLKKGNRLDGGRGMISSFPWNTTGMDKFVESRYRNIGTPFGSVYYDLARVAQLIDVVQRLSYL